MFWLFSKVLTFYKKKVLTFVKTLNFFKNSWLFQKVLTFYKKSWLFQKVLTFYKKLGLAIKSTDSKKVISYEKVCTFYPQSTDFSNLKTFSLKSLYLCWYNWVYQKHEKRSQNVAWQYHKSRLFEKSRVFKKSRLFAKSPEFFQRVEAFWRKSILLVKSQDLCTK